MIYVMMMIAVANDKETGAVVVVSSLGGSRYESLVGS